MRIAEAASRCGLSVDTIRYYEKSNMLPEIPRGPDGQRRFSAENVEWLVLLASLRDTGMPTKTMQEFARLYRAGDHTIPDRKQMLLDHSERLNARRDAIDSCAELLDRKIAIYDAKRS